MKRHQLDSILAQYKHTISWALGIILLFASIAFFQFPFSELQSNLLGDVEKKNHAPFDGTTLPIKKTLDWVGLTSTEYTQFRDGSLTFATAPSNKLIDLPKYDTSILSLDPANLSWNASDKTKRNTLLTFVTAYLGAYTSGSRPAIEGAGSHLAIDIRAPRGTPVYSIANGIVVKTNNGGGNGISATVLHKNVPSIDNPNKTTNYYSSYLHLDSIDVAVGGIVTKGQRLGTVGNTGLATTYHLHFQIDTADAPFVSYWPFTWSEASNAGMDFFTGVNEGLGKEDARRYTIHPMKYVYQYISHSGGSTTTPTTPDPEPVKPDPIPTTPTVPETPTQPTTPPTPDPTPTVPVVEKVTIKAEADATVLAGNPAQIRLIALTESGERATNFQPTSPVRIQSSGLGRLEHTSISTFENGTAHVRYTTSDREEAVILIKYGNQETSVTINVTDKINPVASFRLSTERTVVTAGVPIEIEIATIDVDKQVTPAALYTSARIGTRRGSVSFPRDEIRPQDFVDGIYRMEITPMTSGDATVIIREGAIVGELNLQVEPSQTLQTTKDPEVIPEQPVTPPKTVVTGTTFTDVSSTHPNYKAISYLKRMGVIEGYADGTFRPDQKVNRAEALKMILGGSGIQPKTKVIRSSFPDVDEDAWFAVWVERARDLGIVGGNPDGTFAPASSINGAEHLKIALRTNKVIPEYLYTSDLTKNPYPDVARDAWFAKNYEYAARKNLVPTDTYGKVYPEKIMTRGAVAEVMYRLMILQRTSASVYNDTLLVN